MSEGDPAGGTGRKTTPEFSAKWLVLLALLALGLIAFLALDLDRYASCATLQTHRQDLLDFVAAKSLLAPLLFVAVYVVTVAFSLPGATVLSITGGFLFGVWLSTSLVVVAATLGATVLFVVARSALGEPLRARAGPWMTRMAQGFQENALSYLLVLRLVPLFPFFVVNLVPAFLGVPVRTFVVGTFFGIIPGAIVYNLVGAGLGSIFDAGGECSLEDLLSPQVVAALIGLAVLALIPVVYKKVKARRS